jgi:hypothetical protein
MGNKVIKRVEQSRAAALNAGLRRFGFRTDGWASMHGRIGVVTDGEGLGTHSSFQSSPIDSATADDDCLCGVEQTGPDHRHSALNKSSSRMSAGPSTIPPKCWSPAALPGWRTSAL